MPVPTNEFGQPVGFPVEGWTPRAAPAADADGGSFLPRRAARRRAPRRRAFRRLRRRATAATGPISPTALRDARRVRAWMPSVAGDAEPAVPCDYRQGEQARRSASRPMPTSTRRGRDRGRRAQFQPAPAAKPAATEAMFLMMRRAFDELGYRRYEWKCDALERRLARRGRALGFRFEGIFRQADVVKGRNRDTAWFLDHRPEWPRIKAAFERWLDPGEFRRRRDAARGAREPHPPMTAGHGNAEVTRACAERWRGRGAGELRR